MNIIKKTDKIIITFNKDNAEWILAAWILAAFGYSTDKENYITKNKKRVKTISGKTCKLSEFGGLIKDKNNKSIIVKNNVEELLELAKLNQVVD